METPIIEGNKKNIKIAMPLKRPLIPDGEFTKDDDPVVTVILSKIPAELAAKNRPIIKNIAA
tara:strand:+ start:126 stop:311 length:186 start_codon:yes stop_codon:yes gene_type:complete